MKTLKEFKEYLPIIVLLPAIIGGAIQVLQLLLMSVSFVRFFSITQALTDGILSLSFIITVTIIVIILLFFHKPYQKFKEKVLENIKWNWLRDGFFFITDIFVNTIVFFFILLGCCFFIRSDFEIIEVFYALAIVSFLSALVVVIVVRFKKKGSNKEQSLKEEKYSDHIRWYHIIIFYSLFLLLLLFLINFANSRFDDIQNQNNIYCYLDTKAFEHEVEDYEIQYFNDDYIFVKLYFKDIPKTLKNEVEKSPKSIITVLEFNTLFNLDACEESKTLKK